MDKITLIKKIIPPATREHREDFDGNKIIIDSLNKEQKSFVEDKLLEMILDNDDPLIIDTLVYLKSKASIPYFEDKLSRDTTEAFTKIVLATSIFELDNNRKEMKNIILDFFDDLDKYDLYTAFYYMVKFSDESIDNRIQSFFNHEDVLLSYHSKNAISGTLT